MHAIYTPINGFAPIGQRGWKREANTCWICKNNEKRAILTNSKNGKLNKTHKTRKTEKNSPLFGKKQAKPMPMG